MQKTDNNAHSQGFTMSADTEYNNMIIIFNTTIMNK